MLIFGGRTIHKNKRILVVDDEKSQLEMMDPLLSTQGFDVTLASSGEEGLRLAQKYLPDLYDIAALFHPRNHKSHKTGCIH